jgi:transcriptional regulator with XRE-family HTH domain
VLPSCVTVELYFRIGKIASATLPIQKKIRQQYKQSLRKALPNRNLWTMDVLDEILARAERQNLTQGDLEVRAKLGKARISKWKGGTGKPTFEQVVRMAAVVGASLDELAGLGVPAEMSTAEAMVWRLVELLGPAQAFNVLANALPPARARVEDAKPATREAKAIEGLR